MSFMKKKFFFLVPKVECCISDVLQSEARNEIFEERKKVHDASSSEQAFNVKQMHVLTSSSAVSVENSNMYVDIGAISMVSAFQ